GMAAVLLDLDHGGRVAVGAKHQPEDVLRHQNGGRPDGLRPYRNLGGAEPDGIEAHDGEPGAEEHKYADHEDPVPARLLALHRRSHALLQQGGIVDIKPAADEEAGDAE